MEYSLCAIEFKFLIFFQFDDLAKIAIIQMKNSQI